MDYFHIQQFGELLSQKSAVPTDGVAGLKQSISHAIRNLSFIFKR
jgi:hypothetical protein